MPQLAPTSAILTGIHEELVRNSSAINNLWVQCCAKQGDLCELDIALLYDPSVILVDIEAVELECSTCFDELDLKLGIHRYATEELTLEVVTNLLMLSGFGDRAEAVARGEIRHLNEVLEDATSIIRHGRQEFEEWRMRTAVMRSIAFHAKKL